MYFHNNYNIYWVRPLYWLCFYRGLFVVVSVSGIFRKLWLFLSVQCYACIGRNII